MGKLPLERICTHPKEQSPAIFTPGIKWDRAEKLISDRFWVSAAHRGTAPGRPLLLRGAGPGAGLRAGPGAVATLPGLLPGVRGVEVAAGEQWHRGASSAGSLAGRECVPSALGAESIRDTSPGCSGSRGRCEGGDISCTTG